MKRRVIVIRPNPCGNGLKPIEALTDRGKRYRANQTGVRPPGRKVCNFCGSEKNIGVEHLDGHEENCKPQNLLWACKSCNGRKSVLFKREGLGRRVNQLNPGMARTDRNISLKQYGDAIKVMRGDFDGDVQAAIRTIAQAPQALRSKFTARSWKARRMKYGPPGRDPDKFGRKDSRQGELPF